jgi:diphthine synthase
MNAIGITGLQVYLFGPAVSVPFFTNLWKPYSFLEKIAQNFRTGQHTLVLLDIKVREVSEENLMKGKMIYEKPNFMTVNRAIEQIIES